MNSVRCSVASRCHPALKLGVLAIVIRNMLSIILLVAISNMIHTRDCMTGIAIVAIEAVGYELVQVGSLVQRVNDQCEGYFDVTGPGTVV